MTGSKLGRSGLKVSPICLGTMMFGGPADEATSARIVAKAREAGINFIDSADAYNGGNAEQVVGRAISNNRDSWVLATKLANQMGDDPNRGGLSRRWVLQAADESLRRLGTDYIDIYYLHKEDHATPLEETVRAMGELIRAGKVRYFGVSNYRAWRVAEICNICDRLGIDRPVASQPYYNAMNRMPEVEHFPACGYYGLGIDRPVASQPYYNAMNRMPEVEHFPACGYYGLGIVAYSPLARGVLTGKYRVDAAPDKDTRAGRNDKRMMQTEWRPESLRLAQEIRQHAEAKGITAGQFAVSWVLNSSFVSAVIAGPRTEEQWDDYLKALDYRFTTEDEALINRLVANERGRGETTRQRARTRDLRSPLWPNRATGAATR
ncbi:MAG: aldo/keto reductase [Alphaproteobacteria bacterium]|nr:MAG: aldo/keto reductase [Alphaproteobacteria bacterium]